MRARQLVSVFALVLVLGASVRAEATPIVLTFEDRPDISATQIFASPYMGVEWNNWLEYAPYTVNGYAPDGINAIFASATAPNSFKFATDTRFDGAAFSITANSSFSGSVYFELYLGSVLKHTSLALSSSGANTLTFLSSGYAELVDEVRVITTGNLMTSGGSAWIMDNVSFDGVNTVPEPGSSASLALLAMGLTAFASRGWGRIASKRRRQTRQFRTPA